MVPKFGGSAIMSFCLLVCLFVYQFKCSIRISFPKMIGELKTSLHLLSTKSSLKLFIVHEYISSKPGFSYPNHALVEF